MSKDDAFPLYSTALQ